MPSSTRTTGTRVQAAAPTSGEGAPAQPPGFLLLGRYRLHRPLGAGGFGAVWMARDERLERDVAVKVLPRERIVGGRFEREARAAARLSHPGIVTLYEAAVDDDGAYLVSELVRGSTLSQLLEAGRLSDRDILEIGIVLCDALAHAHAQGVVHRDMKPSNVLVPEHPASPTQVAKLTDFGVARLIGGDTLTRTGDVVGTAAYMAPEQAEGREAGAPADLYSLALVTYEALTGVNPIALGTAAQRARRLGAHLPPLRRQRRDLPPPLGDALDMALSPRERERGTVDELRAQLMDSLHAVGDCPGVVEPPWPAPPRIPQRGEVPDAWDTDRADQVTGGARETWSPEARADPLPGRKPVPLGWPQRTLAGAVGGLAAAWLVTRLPTSAAVAPAAVGLLAAVAIAALPRIGWLALGVTLGAALAIEQRPGVALVVGLAAALPLVVMPRQRTWPVPAVAAGLGAIGLAGAWPAVAGRAPTAWGRAALGAVGWVWTAAAGLLAGRGLYTHLPAGLPADWAGSLAETTNHVLARAFAPGLLAPAALWALAAALLPAVRSRWLGVQVVLATVWSAALASGTVTLLRLSHAGVQARPGAVVLGAVAGWVVVMAPALYGWRARASGPTDTAAGLA